MILGVTTATRERCDGRGPDVDLAVLGEVADRTDGETDGAVDFASRARPWRNRAASTMSRNSARRETRSRHGVALAEREPHDFVERRWTASHLSRGPPPVSAETAARRFGRSPDQFFRRLCFVVGGGRSTGPNEARPHAMVAGRHARALTDDPLTPFVRASAGRPCLRVTDHLEMGRMGRIF